MTVVTNFLMIVEVIVSILLIVVVVAQNSKNAGMGGAVSGAADSSFGGKQPVARSMATRWMWLFLKVIWSKRV